MLTTTSTSANMITQFTFLPAANQTAVPQPQPPQLLAMSATPPSMPGGAPLQIIASASPSAASVVPAAAGEDPVCQINIRKVTKYDFKSVVSLFRVRYHTTMGS